MTTTSVGRQAENSAAEYLVKLGHKILVQNWRTRYCEIDIISQNKGVVFFTEVKYRKSANWGDGLAAITATKHQQMQFAAELWVSSNDWKGDYRLVAVAAEGDPPKIKQLIEL